VLDTLPAPRLDAVFDVTVALGPLADHGATRAGRRRVIPILGGSLQGIGAFAGLGGAEIEPGGADWQLVRPDGAIEIDTRYTARTPQGERIYLQTRGLRTGPPAVLAALARGESVDPRDYAFRITVHFETSAPRLAALEQSVFLASAARSADAVHHRVYRVG